MKKIPKDMDDVLDDLTNYLTSLSDDDQMMFVSRVMIEMFSNGRFSDIERLGMIEALRVDVVDIMRSTDREEEIKGLLNSN